MSIEKMREEFHEAFKAKYLNSINRDMTTKKYEDPLVQLAWWAWKASRESLVIELPAIRKITMGRRENEFDSGFNDAIDLCTDAIEAASLKVKS
jgi:hypothetical protein